MKKNCFLFAPLFLFFACAVSAAQLDTTAVNNAASINSGGVYETINIVGARLPTVDISARLTIVGPGGVATPIIRGAAGANLRVINTTLSLGSATKTNGGMLRGSLYLENGVLRVYGNASALVPPAFAVSAIDSETGKIFGSGEVVARKNSILQAGAIGEQNSQILAIVVETGASAQATGDIFASSVGIDSAFVASSTGNIHVKAASLTGGATLSAEKGNLYLDSVSSRTTPNQALINNTISAGEGSINIGVLDVAQGLTNLVAGKNVVLEKAPASGAGALNVRAGGDVVSEDNENTFEVLTINAGGSLVAPNVSAPRITAGSLNVAKNLEVRGNAVNIYGTDVKYGSLEIKNAGVVGGDLSVSDAKINAASLRVNGSAWLNATEGTVNNLRVLKTLEFVAGTLRATTLNARSLRVGGSDVASVLNVDQIGFSSLYVGRKGVVSAAYEIIPGASITLADGGRFNLASGNLGSAVSPLGAIGLAGGSWLNLPGSLYAASVTGYDTAFNGVIAKGNVRLSEGVYGSLHLNIDGDLTAPSVTAHTLKAASANINGGYLKLTGTTQSELANNLYVLGERVNGLTESGEERIGSFNALKVGKVMRISGASLNGENLSAGLLMAGGTRGETRLNVKNMADGFGLGVGAGAWVSFGQSDGVWLKNLAGSETGGVVGVYSPVKIGSTGWRQDASAITPTPATGKMEFAPQSLLVIYGPNAREDTYANGIISANEPLTATVKNGARLKIDGVVANKNYGVLGDNITVSYEGADAWNENSVETGMHLVGARKIPGRNGWFTTIAKAPETVYPGLDPGLRPPLNEGTGGTASANPGFTPNNPSVNPAAPGTSVAPNPTQPGGPTSNGSGTNVTPPGATQPGGTTSNPSVNPSGPGSGGANTPVTPTTPTQPGSPNNPPVIPSNPGSGGEPATPTQPDKPTTPNPPGNSGSGGATPPANTPLDPGETPPANTGNPAQPGSPNNPPVIPSNPGSGEEPATPTQPDKPTTPNPPGTSGSGSATPPANTPSDSGETPPANTENPAEPESPDAGDAILTPNSSEPAIGGEDRHFNSPCAGVRFLSRVTSVKYMAHDYAGVVRVIESAARMVVLGAVPQMVLAADKGAAEIAGQRAAFADKTAAFIRESELAGASLNLWAAPVWRFLAAEKLTAHSLSYDFNGALGGLVLGADYTFGDVRAGLDVSLGGGYSESGGDLAKTVNNMRFGGFGVYAGWKPGNFGVSADAHYAASWNSLKQDFPDNLMMKNPAAEVTAAALTAGMRVEYRFPWQNWEFIPHAGFRYANIRTDNYSVYSDGAMIDGEAMEQNVWFFPFGAELAGSFETDGGWRLEPSFDFMIIPASGDLYAKTRLNFTGVPGEADIKTQTMDYLTYGGSLGLTLSKDNFSLGISWGAQIGERETEQHAFGTLAYEF